MLEKKAIKTSHVNIESNACYSVGRSKINCVPSKKKKKNTIKTQKYSEALFLKLK